MAHVTRNLPVNSSLKQKLDLGVFLSTGKIGMASWLYVPANETVMIAEYSCWHAYCMLQWMKTWKCNYEDCDKDDDANPNT